MYFLLPAIISLHIFEKGFVMNQKMLYQSIPYVKLPVSRIFYGTAASPFLEGGNGNELLDTMFSLGINAFDTARVYQSSEISIGRWIEERGIRDKIVLLSKCGHPSQTDWTKRVTEKDMRSDLQTSLEYLRTDYIDIYLLHRDDPDVPAGTIAEIFNAMHAEGKIGAFGGSNWTCRRIEEVNEYAYAHSLIPFTVSSPNFGLADQVQDPWGAGCETISGPSHAGDREWYRKNQMPVIAYSSLGRGLFSGKMKSSEAFAGRASEWLDDVAMLGYGYPENYERLRRCEELAAAKNVLVPQIAMAWIHARGLNTFAVVSTSGKERMRQNIDALHINLTPEEADYLDLGDRIS